MSNVELFHQYTAKIFDLLYDEFPVAKDLDVCKLVKKEIDPFELELPKECEIMEHTIYFLKQEGYLWYEKGDINGFYKVRLTSKALAILQKKPKALKANLIETIKHWLKLGNDELVKKSVELIFEGVLGAS